MAPPPRKPKSAVKKSSASALEDAIAAVTSGKANTFQKAAVTGTCVAFLAIAGGMYFMLRSQVTVLSPTDTAALKDVFFSGEPWLVECSKKATKASPVVYNAEGLLKGVKVGVMDCSAVLPSGKSTYERFKIKEPSYGPVLLAAANSGSPQLAPRNVLSSGALLAEWALKATQPKVFTPTSAAQFDGQCMRKAWCVVVVMAGGRLNDAERASLQTLAAAERRVRIVKVDAAKYNLMLDLPGGVPEPTPGQATVLMLKQLPREAGEPSTPSAEGGESDDGEEETDDDADAPPMAATLLPTGLHDVSAVRGAVAAAFASSDSVPPAFSRLVKRPALRPKRAPPTPTPTKTYESNPSPPEPAAKTLTDAELKAMREERAKLIKEAEQQRRAKMAAEEASAANIIEEVDESATEPEDGGSPFAAEEDEAEGEGGGEAAEEEEAEAEEFD